MTDEELAAIRAQVATSTAPNPRRDAHIDRMRRHKYVPGQALALYRQLGTYKAVAAALGIGLDTARGYVASDELRERQQSEATYQRLPTELMQKLLAEVERLRAREAAMREVVEAVARTEGRYASDSGDCCLYCAASTGPVFTGLEDTTLHHGDACVVTKARELLRVETE